MKGWKRSQESIFFLADRIKNTNCKLMICFK